MTEVQQIFFHLRYHDFDSNTNVDGGGLIGRVNSGRTGPTPLSRFFDRPDTPPTSEANSNYSNTFDNDKISSYSFSDPWGSSINSSSVGVTSAQTSTVDSHSGDTAALLGFGLSLCVYFLVVLYLAFRSGGASKRNVDYCLVRKVSCTPVFPDLSLNLSSVMIAMHFFLFFFTFLLRFEECTHLTCFCPFSAFSCNRCLNLIIHAHSKSSMSYLTRWHTLSTRTNLLHILVAVHAVILLFLQP